MRLLIVVLALFAAGAVWGAGSPSAPPGPSVKGVVLEVTDVDTYTYLRLKTKDGETWAAVNKAPVRKGAEVTIENAVVMNNFESKALKKTFDRIVFGSLAGTGAAAAAPAANLRAMHGSVPAADIGNAKVAKAAGADGKTVAEVVAKRTELKDKPVAIRGTVVKVTSGVMGKNWLHLRDGSGAAAEGTNDIVVTTKGEAVVGEIVVAKGVVRTDVNLGSGYSYAVLIEDAKLQK